MELVKPEPLILGGKAYYTLSSYDAPDIEVFVPRVTEDEVTYAYAALIMDAGGEPSDTVNDIWVQKTFNMPGADALHDAVRAELEAEVNMMVEQQKAEACANALASRLRERVLPQRISQIRTQLMGTFARDLDAQGVSQDEFLAANHMTMMDFQRIMDEQAKTTATHEAAILAWAEERGVNVTDDEIPALIGIPEDADVKGILADIRASGQLEDVRQAAVQNKAMRMLVSECSCNYVHETANQAAARVAKMQADMRAAAEADSRNGEDDGPTFKLV